jgi:prephenate dehydrogenase
MRIVLLGFGLIGGSLARALRHRHPATVLVAWSPSGTGPMQAVGEGVLDASVASVQAGLEGADLVVVAAPPIPSLDLLRQLAGPLRSKVRPDTTITDVVSTKARLLAVADAAALPFVGGHPMAGRETPGYASGDADLFVDRPWVVVAGRAARPADVERVEWLARAAGANPIRMSADEHDRAVAAISHLPLVLSAALVEAVAGEGTGLARSDWPTARALASSGWRDMTRLARGDVDMGAGIAATNAAPLAARLRDVRAVLDAWIADLDAAVGGASLDATAIAARLRDARDRLERS